MKLLTLLLELLAFMVLCLGYALFAMLLSIAFGVPGLVFALLIAFFGTFWLIEKGR
jgi:hypothetical protein